MAAVVYVDQTDLENQFGARMVAQVFCDDGSGTPGPRLTRSCSVASRQADAYLLKAWPQDEIATLVENDDAVLSSICKLAMAEGFESRPEWNPAANEDGPAEKWRKSARTTLKDLAEARTRSAGEADAGTNPHVRVGLVNTVSTPHDFIFAPTRNRPKPGGF